MSKTSTRSKDIKELNTYLIFTKTGLELTEQVVVINNAVETISKNVFQSLTIHEGTLMGWKDATSLGDFPAFSNGMIVATL